MAAKRQFAWSPIPPRPPGRGRDRYDIEVVPLKVLFGSETFRMAVDMTNVEFFRKLAVATKLPTTSAPSPGEFAEVYARLAKDYSGCISIHIGAQLSATAEAARVGAASVEGFPVKVVDSETVTMPLAFLCRVAAECSTFEEANAAVAERVSKCRVLALLDTLKYLEMGGRNEPRRSCGRDDAQREADLPGRRPRDQAGLNE